MRNRIIFLLILAYLPIFCSLLSCSRIKRVAAGPEVILAESPANASYFIENRWIHLENGRAEWQAAPGSATKVLVDLFGDITVGELNYDNSDDALVILAYQGGGSGTFFYLGAAISENGQFHGTNAILLGDRIGTPKVKSRNGLITVDYLDRRRDEPMAAPPSVEHTRYFFLHNSMLGEIEPAGGEAIYQGLLTIGHEERSFQPCDAQHSLWLNGTSPALDDTIAAYRKKMAGLPPYTPVFTILVGRRAPPPVEGFGTDYPEALLVSQYVLLWPTGNCRSDFIFLDSPRPGAHISSPLTVKGRARGIWFFEGDFPLALLDGQGRKIADSYATAKGEWMTKDFVEFEGIIHFQRPFAGLKGTLVLKKDNPTGLPQFDDALKIPVYLK